MEARGGRSSEQYLVSTQSRAARRGGRFWHVVNCAGKGMSVEQWGAR